MSKLYRSDLPADNPWSKKVRKLRKERPRYTRPPQPMGTIERYIEAKSIQDYHNIAAVHDLICQLVKEVTLDDPLSPEEKAALAKNKKRVKENPKLKTQGESLIELALAAKARTGARSIKKAVHSLELAISKSKLNDPRVIQQVMLLRQVVAPFIESIDESVVHHHDQRQMPVSTTGKQDDGRLYSCGSALLKDNQVYSDRHGWMDYHGGNEGEAVPMQAKEMIDAVANGAEPRELVESRLKKTAQKIRNAFPAKPAKIKTWAGPWTLEQIIYYTEGMDRALSKETDITQAALGVAYAFNTGRLPGEQHNKLKRMNGMEMIALVGEIADKRLVQSRVPEYLIKRLADA